MKKFKEKWGIKSNFQLIIILLVFSITGSAALWVRKGVFQLLNIDADTTLWLKVPLYIIILIPAYQILILIIGAIFGQYQFFLAFQKKSLGRLVPKRCMNNGSNSKAYDDK